MDYESALNADPEMSGDVAYQAGYQHGRATGSWIIDGNTPETLKNKMRQGIADSDPLVMDIAPSPLSGEFAGSSIPEMSVTFGIDLADEEVASQFETGFSAGFWDQVSEDLQ